VSEGTGETRQVLMGICGNACGNVLMMLPWPCQKLKLSYCLSLKAWNVVFKEN